MDSQVTWDGMIAALQECDYERLDDLAGSLIRWLQSGGFPPDTGGGDALSTDWHRNLAMAGACYALVVAREGRRGDGP